METEILTAVEVAELLKVEKGWVYKMTQKGELPCIKLNPRLIRYRKEDVLKKFIELGETK